MIKPNPKLQIPELPKLICLREILPDPIFALHLLVPPHAQQQTLLAPHLALVRLVLFARGQGLVKLAKIWMKRHPSLIISSSLPLRQLVYVYLQWLSWSLYERTISMEFHEAWWL